MVELEQAELEAVLGHRFGRPELLERALTHSSLVPELNSGKAANEPAVAPEHSETPGPNGTSPLREDNEKLEYLGDAVLGLVVSEYLVVNFPEWSEGQLSKSRANLVNAMSLHGAARRLGLGRYLRLGRGEEKTGGREKPAVLADAYEAVIAAIYLDAGLDAARRFIRSSLLEAVMAEEADRLRQPDDKSGLQEYLQARGLPSAEYRVVNESGPDHCKMFTVEVSMHGRTVAAGTGANKKEAEQAAARVALEQLQRNAK